MTGSGGKWTWEQKRDKYAFQKKNIIGKNIKKFRQLRGLTQFQLSFAAYRTGHTAISMFETGRQLPSLYYLCEMARVLKVPVTHLLVDSDKDDFFHIYAVLSRVEKREVRRYAMDLIRRNKIDLDVYPEVDLVDYYTKLKPAYEGRKHALADASRRLAIQHRTQETEAAQRKAFQNRGGLSFGSSPLFQRKACTQGRIKKTPLLT